MRRRRATQTPLVQVVVCFTLALGGALPAGTLAAGHEVLAMFRAGTLVLPSGSNGAPTGAVTVNSSGIASLFAQFAVDSIAKAFPSFQLAETLGVARTGEVVRLMDRSNIYTLVLADGGDPAGLCAGLRAEPDVVYADPNGGAEPCLSPDDPLYLSGDQWNLNNTGQNGGIPDADIDAPEAWEITTGSAQTIMGIIDTGVDPNHDEFAGKITGNPDFGTSSHGTHVAGIAAANTDNTLGIAGVDWNARINAQRALPPAPFDSIDVYIVQAIGAALAAGAQILNNSWVLYGLIPAASPRYSSLVEAEFSDAYKLNRTAVAAMGNTNQETTYWPAAFGQGIIAVGSTDRSDQRSIYSSSGAHIDVCAPGVAITSTLPSNSYGVNTGTSMATPHVSGLACLMLAANPNLYNDDIEQIIRGTADDLGDPGWDHIFGTGRINARRALERLVSPYVLWAWSEAGGTDVASSSLYPLTFIAVTGLPDGQYMVRRHEVRRSIGFPFSPLGVPDVWGRGVGSRGFSDEGSISGSPDFGINFGRGWCEPVPGSVTLSGCAMRTYVYEVFDAQQALIGWFPCTPANVVYHLAVLTVITPPSSGCPFADTRTVAGWNEENSVLARSLTGSSGLDAYRLCFPPHVGDGKLQFRLRENEHEYTLLDEVRLLAVDHGPDSRAYAVGGRIVLGARVPADRVVSQSGRDVTSLVSGLGGYFQGAPGDTLRVQMSAPPTGGAYGAGPTQDGPGDPGLLEGDPKETEMVSDLDKGAEASLAGATDAEILSSSGILIQVPDGTGDWRDLTHYYPRRYRSETAVDSLGGGTCRLIFLGRHRLHFIGRVADSGTRAAPRELELLSALHSRWGSTLAAVRSAGGATATLDPGDTLTLEFATVAPVVGKVRDWFMFLRGVYSSTPFASQQPLTEGGPVPLPSRLELVGIGPNPFADRTAIQFAVPARCPLRVEVFDVQGRLVRVLLDREYAAGVHLVAWDARDTGGTRVRPGVYLCRLIAGDSRAIKRLLVLSEP